MCGRVGVCVGGGGVGERGRGRSETRRKRRTRGVEERVWNVVFVCGEFGVVEI